MNAIHTLERPVSLPGFGDARRRTVLAGICLALAACGGSADAPPPPRRFRPSSPSRPTSVSSKAVPPHSVSPPTALRRSRTSGPAARTASPLLPLPAPPVPAPAPPRPRWRKKRHALSRGRQQQPGQRHEQRGGPHRHARPRRTDDHHAAGRPERDRTRDRDLQCDHHGHESVVRVAGQHRWGRDVCSHRRRGQWAEPDGSAPCANMTCCICS